MSTAHFCRVFGVLAVVVSSVGVGAPRAADLMDLYARAKEFDPVFQSVRFERRIADEALRETRAGLLPTISASAEGTKTYQNIKESESFLFTEGRTDFFADRFSISLTQPIYRSEVLSRLPQARAEVRQAEARLTAAEQDLIYRLAEAHFSFLAARDNLEFAVAERTAISRQLRETEERLGAGLATMTDVHDARARFAIAEASEIAAEDALEESRQVIAEITGELPVEVASLSDAFPLALPEQPSVEAWVEAARFQNPEVKAREAAVELASGEVRRQRGARRPSLDLVTSFANRDSGGTEFGGGNEIATTDVALRLSVPIFDGGRTSALVRGAVYRESVAAQELERERLRVERETRAAFRGVISGVTRVDSLMKSVFSHEAALARKEEGMRSGLNTGLDVLDARRDLFLAKRDLTQARYVYILNSLKLKQSAGILGVEDIRQINAYLQ